MNISKYYMSLGSTIMQDDVNVKNEDLLRTLALLKLKLYSEMSQGSVVIVSRTVTQPRNGHIIPDTGKRFSLLQSIQTNCGAHPAYLGLSPGVKGPIGKLTTHVSSVGVKKGVTVPLLLHMPSQHAHGQLYLHLIVGASQETEVLLCDIHLKNVCFL